MDRYLSMIIDTETLSNEYKRRVERVIHHLQDDIKLMKMVDKLMVKYGNRVSTVARELGMNRMAVYRIYERLDLKSPSPDPPPKAAMKVCPYCGSEKWEKVRKLYHCLNPECGLEFRGPHAFRRYAFVSVSNSKESK